MKKTNSKIAATVEGYNAPKARVITVKVEGIICDSDYFEGSDLEGENPLGEI